MSCETPLPLYVTPPSTPRRVDLVTLSAASSSSSSSSSSSTSPRPRKLSVSFSVDSLFAPIRDRAALLPLYSSSSSSSVCSSSSSPSPSSPCSSSCSSPAPLVSSKSHVSYPSSRAHSSPRSSAILARNSPARLRSVSPFLITPASSNRCRSDPLRPATSELETVEDLSPSSASSPSASSSCFSALLSPASSPSPFLPVSASPSPSSSSFLSPFRPVLHRSISEDTGNQQQQQQQNSAEDGAFTLASRSLSRSSSSRLLVTSPHPAVAAVIAAQLHPSDQQLSDLERSPHVSASLSSLPVPSPSSSKQSLTRSASSYVASSPSSSASSKSFAYGSRITSTRNPINKSTSSMLSGSSVVAARSVSSSSSPPCLPSSSSSPAFAACASPSVSNKPSVLSFLPASPPASSKPVSFCLRSVALTLVMCVSAIVLLVAVDLYISSPPIVKSSRHHNKSDRASMSPSSTQYLQDALRTSPVHTSLLEVDSEIRVHPGSRHHLSPPSDPSQQRGPVITALAPSSSSPRSSSFITVSSSVVTASSDFTSRPPPVCGQGCQSCKKECEDTKLSCLAPCFRPQSMSVDVCRFQCKIDFQYCTDSCDWIVK